MAHMSYTRGYGGYIGILEKRMETTREWKLLQWGYVVFRVEGIV